MSRRCMSMALLGVLSMLLAPACRDGGKEFVPIVGPIPPITVSSTWSGVYATSLIDAVPVRFDLAQTGSQLTGTFEDLEGRTGTLTGSMSGSVFSFTLTETSPGCGGTFSGSGTSTFSELSFTFTGSDCLGTHSNGQGDLLRES